VGANVLSTGIRSQGFGISKSLAPGSNSADKGWKSKDVKAFGLSIPVSCPEVPAEILNPRNGWADKEAYDRQAAELAARFEANFKQFDASEAIRNAGPKAQ